MRTGGSSIAYSIEFTIPGLPPTTNSGARRHWAIQAKTARTWKSAVIAAVGRNRPPQPLVSAALELTRVSSGSCDPDGLVSSFKAVIDGLVSAGVLIDDKFKNIGMPSYKLEMASPGKGYIKVSVKEKI